MDTFKYKDRGTEKFWLVVIVSSFINLNLSSIDNVFLGNYLHINCKYVFLLLIPIIMLLVYFLFVKHERFLDYNFKESYKGYSILIILFIITIVLMLMVVPRKNY